jgi:ketosteroid isomerase-like protein
MSREDVDVVRDQFAATNERDFERAMSRYSDDVVLVAHGFLNPGTFQGREAVGRWFGEWFQSFKPDYRFVIEEARDLGEVVLIIATHGGHGRASGVAVSAETSYLYKVRDGKVARVEIFDTRAGAGEAAGLDE